MNRPTRFDPSRSLLCAGVAALFALWSASPAEAGTQSSGQAGGGATAADPPIVLITGSTDGLGREVAMALGREGAHVIVHGRNEERGRAVVEAIESEGTGTARFIAADLASFDEVRAFAHAIREEYDRLDVLINNAGIWLTADQGRQLSQDGHELHFQVNYLSTFLLTHELLPLLEAGAPSRIIHVSSVAQAPIDFDDVMLEEGYSDGRAYSQSKLAQILFAKDLAEELEGTGVLTASVHPATVMDTNMVLARGMEPRTSVEEGLAAVLNVVRSDEIESGAYYRGLEKTEAHDQAYDREARERLRVLSERLTRP